MSKNGDNEWPRWPAGTAGNVILDVVVDKKIDELFLMLYGGETEFKVKCNEALANKDYTCTPWVSCMDELDQPASSNDDKGSLPDASALKAGMMKKTSYSSSSMGVKFKSDELVRLVEAAPGSTYILEFCVSTTATYGDKFRPILRHELRGLESGRTAMKLTSSIVFVKSVNGLLKGMIERGARDGMGRNFATFRKVLEGLATVTDAAAAAVPVAPSPPRRPRGPAAEGVPGAAPAPTSVLEVVAGGPLVRHLQPWAAYLQRVLEPYPVVGGLGEEGIQTGLAVLYLLCALRVIVDLLRFVEHASAEPQDTVAVVTHYVFKAIDMPDNVQEVLGACVLLYLVRVLVNRVAACLPRPPRSQAAGGGAQGASGTGCGAVLAGCVRSDGEETQGVQYEGYARVIADADKWVREDESALTGSQVEASGMSSGMQRLNEQVHVQTSKAVSRIKGNFKEFTASVKALAGSSRSGAKAASFTPAADDQQGSAVMRSGLSGSFTDQIHKDDDLEEESSTPPPDNGVASAGSSPTKSSRVIASPRLLDSVPRAATLSASAAIVPPATTVAAATVAEAGVDKVVVTEEKKPAGGARAAGLEGQSTAAPTAAVATTPIRHSSTGSEAEGAGAFFSMKLLRRSATPGDKTPGSANKVASSDGSTPRRSTSNMEASLANGRLQHTTKALMPANVPPHLQAHALTAEMFENQRLQPFRGWGHTWPGHFLPHDKVCHWSLREIPNHHVVTGQDFENVAPQLAEGWSWVEDEWRVDKTGQEVDAVDDGGWAYGLDFGWVREHPFQAGQGKKKVTDFVRRRRWIRTQVPASNPAGVNSGTASAAEEPPLGYAIMIGDRQKEGSIVSGEDSESSCASPKNQHQLGAEGEGKSPGSGSSARRALARALGTTEAASKETGMENEQEAAPAPAEGEHSVLDAAISAGKQQELELSPLTSPTVPDAAAVPAQHAVDAGHVSLCSPRRPPKPARGHDALTHSAVASAMSGTSSSKEEVGKLKGPDDDKEGERQVSSGLTGQQPAGTDSETVAISGPGIKGAAGESTRQQSGGEALLSEITSTAGEEHNGEGITGGWEGEDLEVEGEEVATGGRDVA